MVLELDSKKIEIFEFCEFMKFSRKLKQELFQNSSTNLNNPYNISTGSGQQENKLEFDWIGSLEKTPKKKPKKRTSNPESYDPHIKNNPWHLELVKNQRRMSLNFHSRKNFACNQNLD